MLEQDEVRPIEPGRVKAFARFFKNYMSVSSVVAAALPIPVTAAGLIATYKFQTKTLSVYTSLFCFLILAFIFFTRHFLARVMFPEVRGRAAKNVTLSKIIVGLSPFFLIVLSLVSVLAYHRVLSDSISNKRKLYELPPSEVSDSVILEKSFESQTPEAPALMMYYLAIFMTAEAAFVLMAIREYLQDLLKLTEIELIRGEGGRAETGGRRRDKALKASTEDKG